MSNEMSFFKRSPLVAVVRGVSSERIVDVARNLSNGGIKIIEITFGREDVTKSIKLVREEFGDQIFVGAGTVTKTSQVDVAYEAGAKFIFSPNTDVRVIKHTKKRGLISIPGAFTPSEVVTANHAGADAIKIFPASQLGPKFIKALKGPLPDLKLIPTGGIDSSNICSYFRNGAFAVGVGGSLVDLKVINNGDYHFIQERAKELVEQVRDITYETHK